MRTNSALLEKVISMEPRLPCPEIFTGVPNCLASTLEIFLYCGEEGFLAGAAYAASSLLSGCGHTIDVTAERTEICRDGACLVLEPGRLSYSQAQPETEVQPVIQRIRKGK